MKLYMCEVWNGFIQEQVLVGIFSTPAKALEAGSAYINARAHGTAHLLDWEELSTLTYWYEDDAHNPFTRIVTECVMDERLV